MAVNPEQIEELSLTTRPTKDTDSRSKNFEGESVEVDAIEPWRLKLLARECIAQHIDPDVYRRTMEVESAERATLDSLASRWESEAGEDQGGAET